MLKKLVAVMVVLLVVVLILVGTYVGYYNKFVSSSESIKSEWAQIETVLQRRSDLIPNLVSTVQGYAKHEKEIFENVANARAMLSGARNANDKIKANNALDGALSRLLAIAENYPNLKANENFIRLQDELAGTENRISVARTRYNETVRAYNVMVKRIPGSLIAGIAGFRENTTYFEAEVAAQTVPKVQF